MITDIKHESMPAEVYNTIAEIYNTIREISTSPTPQTLGLPSQRNTYKAHFEVDWDISAFLEDYRKVSPNRALGRALTLTGSLVDAQAASVSEYMCQTWDSHGKGLLGLMEKLSNNASQSAEGMSLYTPWI